VLEFSILGPLQMRLGERVLPLGGAKQRSLLAYLVLHANELVPSEQIIEEVWGPQPPPSAASMLRVYVSKLRKLTAAAPDDVVVTRPPGYLLTVAAEQIDARRFERLVNEARGALGQGEAHRASELLREALALWRGEVLADLRYESFTQVERARLAELRRVALGARIDAELALGRHESVIGELEALVADDPLQESWRRQLILALYRAGRQPDALAAYRETRRVLVEELGIEPSKPLRLLEQAILRQDPALEPPAHAAASSARLRDPERGIPRQDETLNLRPGRTAVLDPPAAPDARAIMATVARHRRTWAAVLVAMAAVAAAAVVVPLVATGSRGLRRADQNGLALVSPRGKLTAVLPLAAAPTNVAVGFGSLWASQVDSGTVVRVDLRRRAVVQTVRVGNGPDAIAVGAGDVWVVNTLDGTLARIDPGTDMVTQTVPAGSDPTGVAVGAGSVWVSRHGDGTVARLDPETGRVRAVVKVGRGAGALALAGGSLWVADEESGTVARIDARTGTLVDTIHAGDAPSALVATRTAVWVLDRLDSTLSRIDTARDTVEATYPIPGGPQGLTAMGGTVSVGEADSGSLWQLDSRSGAPAKRTYLGGQPQALAASGDLWVALRARGSDHRGGVLTEIPANDVIDTIDPAGSTSWNIALPQLLGLTNDGLVTLDHAAGPDGARLVPDLALSLPRPADGGRTYTFRLRPQIHYSSGPLVLPSDVRHSFERLFEIGSSGADLYRAITGASGCARRPASCDLSQGIVADDHSNTVAFHLTHADPDFLYKLTLPSADVLPASAPPRESRVPLPATGPYMIVQRTQRQVRLVRNPRFHEWSAAAQPDGYPDAIVLRAGLSGARPAGQVIEGKADFRAGIGVIGVADRDYFLLHRPSRIRINPVLATGFLFMNVNAPPFNAVRVRRALNLALDRARIVAADGGPTAARPTCQIVPPHLPGYQRYCPYTRNPGADGRWRGPDLARARRLVGASGTKGMRVTVWDTLQPQQYVAEGRVAVAALRRLGYRAALRLLPDNTYFTYTNDSRHGAQVIDGGWNANYPTADDFIGKLTCSFFVPADGTATTDGSELCDPALDNAVARAATLQTTDPLAANALWAKLDRKLTDLAVWLPTTTPYETDLLSNRVSNYQYNPVWGPLIDQLWVR
jgi:peptide/nickel transport system substrate-binding protein